MLSAVLSPGFAKLPKRQVPISVHQKGRNSCGCMLEKIEEKTRSDKVRHEKTRAQKSCRTDNETPAEDAGKSENFSN